MNIWFRVDSSKNIGAGHLMRCLNLAKFLRKQEKVNHVQFICKKYATSLISAVRDHNFVVHEINAQWEPDRNTKTWLGSDWEHDATQSINIIDTQNTTTTQTNNNPLEYNRLLIIDHYAIGYQWEQKLADYVDKIMVIDDIYDRQHYCHILLDQNCINHNLYNDLVPNFCQRLLGYQYVILNEKILKLNRFTRTCVKNILISLGGYCDISQLEKIIKIIQKQAFQKVEFHIVLGLSPIYETIKTIVQNNSNIHVYGFIDFSELLDKIDLSIGAIGSSVYERSYLGIPTIGITVADNQIEIAKTLDKINIIQYIGHECIWDSDNMYDQLIEYITNSEKLKKTSNMCMSLVDGLGKTRILSAIMNYL